VPTSEELSPPPQGAGLHEEEEAMATGTSSSSSAAAAAAASSKPTLMSSCEEGDSEEDEEHITLHQQPTKVIPQGDIDDDDSVSTYPMGLKTGELVHSLSPSMWSLFPALSSRMASFIL